MIIVREQGSVSQAAAAVVRCDALDWIGGWWAPVGQHLDEHQHLRGASGRLEPHHETAAEQRARSILRRHIARERLDEEPVLQLVLVPALRMCGGKCVI